MTGKVNERPAARVRAPQWASVHWQEMVSVFDKEKDPPLRPEEEMEQSGYFLKGGGRGSVDAVKSPPKAGRWADLDWNEMGLVFSGSREALDDLEPAGEKDGGGKHDRGR